MRHPTPDLIPHVLRLVDPGPRVHETGFLIGQFLTTDARGWVPGRDESAAFVFPSWSLAHRFALRFLSSTGEVWMPVPAPGRTSSVPGLNPCRGCGCTEAFACPGRCGWAEPTLCSECTRDNNLEIWVVYQSPDDYPGKVVARKTITGIPTTEVQVTDSLDEMRALMPAGMTPIPRSEGDPGSVVETWL